MTNYLHNFNVFREAIRVDGVTYTSNTYQALTHEARIALCEEAVERCVLANRRSSATFDKTMEPLRAAFKADLTALQNHPRFAKRYRGRAADMRYQEQILRNTFGREQRDTWDAQEPIDGTSYPTAVHDVFHTWEKLCETTYEQFERLVSHHDWYYNYSDDHSVWSAGNRVGNQISGLLKVLQTTEHAEAAQLLYNQKCPWRNEDGSKKEERNNG